MEGESEESGIWAKMGSELAGSRRGRRDNFPAMER